VYQICSEVNVELELPFSHLYLLKSIYITRHLTYGKYDVWSLQKDVEKNWPFLLDLVWCDNTFWLTSEGNHSIFCLIYSQKVIL